MDGVELRKGALSGVFCPHRNHRLSPGMGDSEAEGGAMDVGSCELWGSRVVFAFLY